MDARLLSLKNIRYVAHVLGWICYTTITIVHNNAQYTSSSAAKIVLVMPLCMAIFYTVLQIAMWVNHTRQWVLGGMTLLLFYLLGIGIGYGYIYSLAPKLGVSIQVPDKAYSHSAYLRSIFLFYSRFSFFALAVFLLEKCLAYASGKKQDRARIAELKASSGLLSVHFLGNVLQRCYGVWNGNNAKQQRLVAQVDSLIQYALDVQVAETDTLTTLRKEVEHLQALMALQRVGEPGGPCITLQVPETLAGYKVPPLTLITAYENILKHGVTDNPAQPACMQLKIVRGGYHFRAYNKIADRPQPADNRASLGLGMVRSRLELQLHNQFTLHYGRQGYRFLFHLYVKT